MALTQALIGGGTRDSSFEWAPVRRRNYSKALVTPIPIEELNVTKEFVIIAAAALASSPVAAQDIVVVSPSFERVAYADLDLSSEFGRDRLGARIRSAAENLCIEDGLKPLAVKTLENACFKAAVADGLQQAERIADAQRSGRALAATTIVVRAK